MVIKEDVALVSLKAPHTINDAVNTLRLMQLPDGSFLDARATSDRIMARHAHWEAQVTIPFLLSLCSQSLHLMHCVNLEAEAVVTCRWPWQHSSPQLVQASLLVNTRLEQSQAAGAQVAAQIRKSLAPETAPLAHMLSTSGPPPGLGPDALEDNSRRSDAGSMAGSFDECTVDFSTCWICGETAADFKAIPCLHVITCGWV